MPQLFSIFGRTLKMHRQAAASAVRAERRHSIPHSIPHPSWRRQLTHYALPLTVWAGLTGSLLLAPVMAQTTVPDSPANNPIDLQRAQLEQQKQQAEQTYEAAATLCYERFFVNACLDKAKEARRVIVQQINREQVRLNDQERQGQSQQRERDAALKRQQAEQEAPLKAAERQKNLEDYSARLKEQEAQEAKRAAVAAQAAGKKAAYEQKQRSHTEQEAKLAREAQAEAQRRADNQAAYDQKRQAAQAHAADKARQKAEKARRAKQQPGQATVPMLSKP